MELCHAKARNVPAEHKGEFGWGDVWTWTAIDADTKLVPSWLVSGRDASTMPASTHATTGRVPPGEAGPTHTDGLATRRWHAVEGAFGADTDYADAP